jgi:hypothetical protein
VSRIPVRCCLLLPIAAALLRCYLGELPALLA